MGKHTGPSGAHAELTARLRAAMTGQGMRQADLAKAAGLSTGAISTVMNGRSVPTIATLELLAGALGVTGDALKELYRLRDAADVRVRRLDDYLHAARRAAREQPYPAVPADASGDQELPDLPPLATVYVRQHAHQLPKSDAERAAGEEEEAAQKETPVDSLPAEEALTGEHTCVLLGGPGGGKTSLLRMRLAHGVERWIDGRGEDNLPVLVPAAGLLDRPLPEALAAAVKAELAAFGLTQLPADLFAGAPQPGVRWLILVDGLDEIVDGEARRRVLRTLAAVAAGPHAQVYRFVVATRPLARNELRILGERVPHYELQPFAPAEVEAVACGWFRALKLKEPQQAAERFTQALRRSRLSDLARIPLVVAMLCQLRAARPGSPLPGSRGELYGNFIALLRERQYPVRPQQIDGHRLTGLERYNSAAVTARAEHVAAHLDELIAYLAAERRSGNTRPATEIIEAHADGQCPSPVAAHHWTAFLTMVMRRSGLLILRAGELVFLHQTFLEYLAARHATRNADVTKQTLFIMFHQPARFRSCYDCPGVRPRVWLWRYWKPPQPRNASFVGFLLDVVQQHDPAVVLPYLFRLASTRAGMAGCEFLAGQAAQGTAVPERVIPAAIEVCSGWAFHPTTGVERVEAAHLLARLGDPRGADICAEIAENGDPVGFARRGEAVAVLAELNDARAAELAHLLANDTRRDVDDRMTALATLVRLGDIRSVEIYIQMAREPKLVRVHRPRHRASRIPHPYINPRRWSYRDTMTDMVMRVRDPRAADVFAALARHHAVSAASRLRAAGALAALGDVRAAELYRTLAADLTSGEVRVKAAEQLTAMGDPAGPDAYLQIAEDARRPVSERMQAAKALTGLGDPRAADAYAQIAAHPDPDTLRYYQADIGKALVALGDPRAGDLYIAVAEESTRNGRDRLAAAQVVVDLGDPRAADLYSRLASDPTLTGGYAPLAAKALARFGDERGVQLLVEMVVNVELQGSSRAGAAQALLEVGDERAADLCLLLAADTRMKAGDQVQAARALAGCGDPRGVQWCARLAGDPAVDDMVRVTLAKELAEREESCGAELCAALAGDTSLRAWSRLSAAEALAGQGDPRAADLYATLATDPGCSRLVRQWAVKLLNDQGQRRMVPALLRVKLAGWQRI
ncbi:helix-turn-helix domain-containing protein [Nonomuraea polychroma]|uniref:helix-turn-helix domain-containing protein n=1 Tax=Nonomuraea polychroma TaxID=46176 RepID=UPI003D8A7B2A